MPKKLNPLKLDPSLLEGVPSATPIPSTVDPYERWLAPVPDGTTLSSYQKKRRQEALQEMAKRELARRHLLRFITYNYHKFDISWHHRLLAEKLEMVEAGTLTRLLVLMPPRHGKSEMCSVQFPAWLLGKDKDKDVIQISYGADLAVEFGRQVRNLMLTKEYKNVFPGVTLAEDSQAKGKWNTNGRGAYNAAGVGGSTTGKGASVLILDDVLKNRKEADSELNRDDQWSWYRSTARTRLAPNGAIILVMTHWHLDDLAGRILDLDDTHEWTVLKLPAIATEDEAHRKQGEALWPARFDLKALESVRKDIGPYEFASLYQQNPVASENQEFMAEWFHPVPRAELLRMNTRKFLTVDTAFTKKEESDFSGFIENYVDENDHWYVKATRLRLNGQELIDYIFKLQSERNFEKIGLEKGAYTEGLRTHLTEEMAKRGKDLPIVELDHKQTAKETRIRAALLPRYATGKIHHLAGECDDLERELLTFPKGQHDDLIDSLAYQEQIAEAAYIERVTDKIKEAFNPFSLFG